MIKVIAGNIFNMVVTFIVIISLAVFVTISKLLILTSITDFIVIIFKPMIMT